MPQKVNLAHNWVAWATILSGLRQKMTEISKAGSLNQIGTKKPRQELKNPQKPNQQLKPNLGTKYSESGEYWLGAMVTVTPSLQGRSKRCNSFPDMP